MDNEQFLKNRILDGKRLVNAFNRKHKKSVVYLKLTDSDSGSFHIHFRFNDKFIDSRAYDEGTAYTYVTDALYEEIQALAGDKKLSWNNTGSVGWISYEQ
jgi:hypothetical protein